MVGWRTVKSLRNRLDKGYLLVTKKMGLLNRLFAHGQKPCVHWIVYIVVAALTAPPGRWLFAPLREPACYLSYGDNHLLHPRENVGQDDSLLPAVSLFASNRIFIILARLSFESKGSIVQLSFSSRRVVGIIGGEFSEGLNLFPRRTGLGQGGTDVLFIGRCCNALELSPTNSLSLADLFIGSFTLPTSDDSSLLTKDVIRRFLLFGFARVLFSILATSS